MQLPVQIQALMVAPVKWWSSLGGGSKILLVYGLAWIGGWLIVGAFMRFMRWTVGNTKDRSLAPLDFWLGGTERCVAVTLIWSAPGYLASFIGAWIALKFAAHWKRQEIESGLSGDDRQRALQYVTNGSLLFLIGSAISFAVAVACGLLLNPGALETWAAPPRPR